MFEFLGCEAHDKLMGYCTDDCVNLAYAMSADTSYSEADYGSRYGDGTYYSASDNYGGYTGYALHNGTLAVVNVEPTKSDDDYYNAPADLLRTYNFWDGVMRVQPWWGTYEEYVRLASTR